MAIWTKEYSGQYNVPGDMLDDTELFNLILTNIDSTSYWNSTLCYDRLVREFDATVFPAIIEPHTIVEMEAPLTARLGTRTNANRLRIESTDGTRWVDIYTDYSTRLTYFTCSNASYDDGPGVAAPNYSGRVPLCELIVNSVTGAVSYKGWIDTSYSSSCSSGTDTILQGTTAGAVFNIGERLHIKYKYLGNPGSISYMYWSGTVMAGSDHVENLVPYIPSLDNVNTVFAATQDNAISGKGSLYHKYGGTPTASQEDQDKWTSHFETSAITQVYWYTAGTGYLRLRYQSDTWQAKTVFSLNSTDLTWTLFANNAAQLMFISTDELRWVKFWVDEAGSGQLRMTSSAAHDVTGETWVVPWYARLWVLSIKNGNITFLAEAVGEDPPTQLAPIPFTDVFNAGESVHCAVGLQDSDTLNYLYRYSLIVSADLPPQGQSQMRFDVPEVTSDITDLIVDEYMCYVRTKIRNSLDYSDPASLFAMDAGHPSDANLPLRENDTCIVLEKFNRIYMYSCRSGDMAHNLPYIIRMTNVLYWELMDATPDDQNVKMEQYDIIGLVDTNEVIVIHTKHNRELSYAPAVQLLHGNVVRTEGIQVAVKSDTELRISTIETSVLTNLKINIYVNP